MSAKTGIVIGLMIGLVIASGAVGISLVMAGGAIKDRESKAWQAGYDARGEHSVGEQKSISSTLNQGLINENEKLMTRTQNARAQLKDLLARQDLTADARRVAEKTLQELGQVVDPDPIQPPEPVGDPYDDAWGKLETPDAAWKVTHVLVTWEGTVVPAKEKRTKEGARKLIDEIWRQYKADPTVENWRKLQVKYNEDSAPHSVYDHTQSLIEPFKAAGRGTRQGFARIVESQYGYHLVRRES